VKIYALVDPVDACIHYIGSTRSIEARIRGHRWMPNGTTQEWILGLRPKWPKIVPLTCTAEALRDETEYSWIEWIEERGFDLLNGQSKHGQFRQWDIARPSLSFP
jgi:hypothetical protein